jgi:MFS family permease
LILAAVTLLIREPTRAVSVAAEASLSTRAVYRELCRNPRYVATVAGYVAQTFAVGGFAAWAAPFLERRLCLHHDIGSIYFGLILVVTGIVGTAVGGWLADRVKGDDRLKAGLRVCAWSAVVAAPLAAMALLAPSPALFLVMLGLSQLAIFASTSPTNVAILSSVPTSLRANAMAASIFAIHLFGDMVSPTLIGVVADRFGDSPAPCSGGHGLTVGMSMLPAALALTAVFWFRGARRQSPR